MNGLRRPQDAGTARLVRIALLLVLLAVLSVELQALVLAVDAIGLEVLLLLIGVQVRFGWRGLARAFAQGVKRAVSIVESLPAAAVRLLGLAMPVCGTTVAARQILFDCAMRRDLSPQALLMTALLMVVGLQG